VAVDDSLVSRDISAPFDFPADNGRICSGRGQLFLSYRPGPDNQLIVVPYGGELSSYSAPYFRSFLLNAMNYGFSAFIISLEEVSSIEPAGIGVLVGVLKRARASGGFADIVCTQEALLEIFRITGLTKFFAIYDTLDDAINARDGELSSS
jgi:anti-sigma B factor antagonist